MDEMILLKRLRDRDPESASNVVANGQLMVEWAGQGNVKKLQCALDHMDEVRRKCRKYDITHSSDSTESCIAVLRSTDVSPCMLNATT